MLPSTRYIMSPMYLQSLKLLHLTVKVMVKEEMHLEGKFCQGQNTVCMTCTGNANISNKL